MQLSRLIAYALPALPIAALTLPLYILVPTFYSETLGVSLASVGAALLFVRIFDAVNDPLVGYVADRWRPGFGRRRMFFLLSLPVTALSALMLFWPPQGAGGLYIAVWGAALSVGYTATLLPYSAWGAELAGTYAGRSRVAAFRESFTLVGTLLAISLPFAIGLDNAAGLHGLAVLGIVVGALLLVLGSIAVWIVPEPVEYSIARLSMKEGLSHMAANRPFVRLIAAYFINGLANGIPATLFLYFVSDRLGAPDMRGPLLFVYFLAGIAGVPIAAWLAGKVGKHRAWCYAMVANCLLFGAVPFLAEGAVYAFGAICILTGICLGFDLALPAAIQADVIDVDTAASGDQRSGLYFAAWSLSTKLSLALGVGIVFPLLGAFGFVPGGENSGTALTALVSIYVWLPLALKVIAIALTWNFPLGEAQQAALRSEIESRRR
jgi:GPH family glycoside/pentoside/hexuronide:cation symporter